MYTFVISMSLAQVSRGFDFWVKSGYMMLAGIAKCVWRYANNGGAIGIITNVLLSIYEVLLIVFMSSFDASNRMKRKWKIVTSVTAAAMWFWVSIYTKLLMSPQTDYLITIPLGVVNPISTQGLIGSYYQILAIFMLKQAVNSFIKKEKAVSISVSPFIKWSHLKQYDPVPQSGASAQAIQIEVDPAMGRDSEGKMSGVPRIKSTNM